MILQRRKAAGVLARSGETPDPRDLDDSTAAWLDAEIDACEAQLALLRLQRVAFLQRVLRDRIAAPGAKATVVRSITEVAQFFGVASRLVQTEWRGAGMPGSSGHWDLAVIAAWRSLRQAGG